MFGGCGPAKDGTATVFDQLFSLDINTWTWSMHSRRASSPRGRRRHSASAITENRILIFGGEGKQDQSYDMLRLNDIWVLDVSADPVSWNLVIPPDFDKGGSIPDPRCHHSAVVFDHQVWLFGGCGGPAVNTLSCLGDLWALDLRTFIFSRLNTMGGSPKPRAGHSASLVDGRIMIIAGGRDHAGALDDIHLLHLETLSWSWPAGRAPAPMPAPASGHVAAAVDSVPSPKLFIFGGQTSRGGDRHGSWTLDHVR